MAPGPQNVVESITEIFACASTFPCRVKTQDGKDWVMKLGGSGPGPMALLTELLALRIASTMGLPVPSCAPLYLPPDFPWTIGTDEFDGIVQRSFGWNLGVSFIPDARTASAEEVLAADPAFLEALADVDRALSNMDRAKTNPNVLATPEGLVAIDFDACLFLRRAARAVTPTYFPLPAGHLLEGRNFGRAHLIDAEVAQRALREAPAQWLDLAQLSLEALARKLSDHVAAWNAH